MQLNRLSDWKNFERLCADLLSVEGFIIESEPSVDTSGTDFIATETYRSHDPERTLSVRWRVQCKHYAPSGRNLGRQEVEAVINAYEARRTADEGLFIIVSSDYTEPAQSTVQAYVASRPHARVTIWNARHVIAKLERHAEIVRRYGLDMTRQVTTDPFGRLKQYAGARTLFVSDQSSFAHDLARALRRSGLDLLTLPVWNYLSSERLNLFLAEYRDVRFRLVVLFLGDTFSTPLPRGLIDWISSEHERGASILFFPFLAWTLRRGAHEKLGRICPAHLIDPKESIGNWLTAFGGKHRMGDFSWLLAFESFVEDRFVEYDPSAAKDRFASGIGVRFGVSHSFEILAPLGGCQIAWADTSGNPLLITRNDKSARVAYINSCCHACLSTVPVSSPLDASEEFSQFTANVLQWLLESPLEEAG